MYVFICLYNLNGKNSSPFSVHWPHRAAVGYWVINQMYCWNLGLNFMINIFGWFICVYSISSVSYIVWNNPQACRPVIVTSDFLLTSLASCKYTISLPVLKLVNAALSSMSAAAPVSGKSIQFIKRQQNFISTRVFTKRELKQVYMYLQQYVVKVSHVYIMFLKWGFLIQYAENLWQTNQLQFGS